MDEIIYRELVKEDYKTIEKMIGEAFGFNNFIKDEELLYAINALYLEDCINGDSFSKVAVKDNKIIGIILGNVFKDKNRLKKYHQALRVYISLINKIITNKDYRKAIKEFSKVFKTYDELIKDREKDFQGCIDLFIVSKEARGHGVGKALLKYLDEYMKSMYVKSIYVYTDTICNYGFYESQNFNRLDEKEVYLKSFKQELCIFLYGYRYE